MLCRGMLLVWLMLLFGWPKLLRRGLVEQLLTPELLSVMALRMLSMIWSTRSVLQRSTLEIHRCENAVG